MRTTPSARRRARRITRRDRLKVSATQSARLRMFASLLDVRPGDFVEWILGDHIKSLDDPDIGLLAYWAEREIIFDDPAQAAKVAARVREWLARKRIESRMLPANAKGGIPDKLAN